MKNAGFVVVDPDDHMIVAGQENFRSLQLNVEMELATSISTPEKLVCLQRVTAVPQKHLGT